MAVPQSNPATTPSAAVKPAPPVIKSGLELRLEELEHAVESLGAHLVDAGRQDLAAFIAWFEKRVQK